MENTCFNCVFCGEGLCGNQDSAEYLEPVATGDTCDAHTSVDQYTGSLFEEVE